MLLPPGRAKGVASPWSRRKIQETAAQLGSDLWFLDLSLELLTLEINQGAKLHCSMEDLPEPLLAEIIKRIPSTIDLNSFSLMSKRFHAVEAEHREAICVGCGLFPATLVMASLCSRFPNLRKVNISYYGWTRDHVAQLDNQGLRVLSSSCLLLNDLTLMYCSNIDDSGLAYIACCKKLMSLRLHFVPAISSSGLLSLAVGCKSLSSLHLIDCDKVDDIEWLEHLGRTGSLEELVVMLCEGVSQYDLLKFGPGWMKLQRFEFEGKGNWETFEARDRSYVADYQYKYDFCCESLKRLRLARIITLPEIGIRSVLGKCKALESLCLHFVSGLDDGDMIALSRSCSNLRSIKLVLTPLFCPSIRPTFSTSLTDDSLKALALGCPKLQEVDLAFSGCSPDWPSEISFTQEGLLMLIQSCPIRVLVLTGNFFDDEGMEVLSSAQFLETLELFDCVEIIDAGIRSIARTPRLMNLALRVCPDLTDEGVAKLTHEKKLESLIIQCCRQISPQAVQGAATSVHYSLEPPNFDDLRRY